jgi:hypothetical protein
MEASWQGQRCRSGTAHASIAQKDAILKRKRSDAAVVQPRADGGRFAVPPPKRQLLVRPAPQRASREADVVQSRFDAYVIESQQKTAAMQAQHAAALQNLDSQLKQKHKEMLAMRMRHRNQQRGHIGHLEVPSLREKKMQGGGSAPTLLKTSQKIETALTDQFANLDVRARALYQHHRRHPEDYLLITTAALNSRGTFEELCRTHPEWLHPRQRAVIQTIEKAWTLDQCLGIRVHCKVGHREKYQTLIHLLGKIYNSRTRQWVPKEIMGAGSKLYLPSLKSKNAVNGHRDQLHAIIPLLQNKDGTSCWTDLLALIEETIRLDREHGNLQSRT